MHPPFVILEKTVGQTPLEVTEAWRSTKPELTGIPLAYAGRLDPMASGQLLVLIGEECKHQEKYHNLDKEYLVSMLFGIASDSGDVLGLVTESGPIKITSTTISPILNNLVGEITMPYPVFSSKTVAGKPLHTWTMENRLSEIIIPTKTSHIYKITLNDLQQLSRLELVEKATKKISLLPPVTDPRKSLGNDFRRPDVYQTWDKIKKSGSASDIFFIANTTVTASSGTYMRSLTEVVAKALGTTGLAFAIHRSKIGHFDKTTDSWTKLLG